MDLTLKEKFLLLAFHPEKGYNMSISFSGYGIAGAMLLELAALNKIKIEDGKIRLLDSKKTGDDPLDYLIEVLHKSDKLHKVKNIISKIQGKSSKIKKPLIEALVKKRYLRKEEKRFLVFKYNRYPSANLSYRKDLIEHIRRLVLRNIKSEEDIPLLTGLSGACRLSDKYFKTKEERKIARKRIKEIVKESDIDQAIDETVKAVQAAIMISITASVATSAATS
jgi:Golgi phosphoprotein 3